MRISKFIFFLGSINSILKVFTNKIFTTSPFGRAENTKRGTLEVWLWWGWEIRNEWVAFCAM
jgi:hypothetical protein